MTEQTSKQLLDQVATLLGGEYSARNESERECYGTIELRTGTTFGVHVDGYGHQDRVRVSSLYPKHEDRHGGQSVTLQRDFDRGVPYDHAALGEITISKHKSAAQIAKDIENRWLKLYNPLYALALEYCARQAAEYSKRGANKNRVTATLAGLGRYDSGHAWRVEVLNVWADSVDLSIRSLTVDQVEKLAELLRTF